MAHTSTTITAPVSVDDAKAVLGSGSNDVGTLCTHTGINKWSRFKPVRHTDPAADLDVDSAYRGYVPDDDYNGHNVSEGTCGLLVLAHTTSSEQYLSWWDDSLFEHDWEYLRPTGKVNLNGAALPETHKAKWTAYRLGDFDGYVHTAAPPYAGPLRTPATLPADLDTTVDVMLGGRIPATGDDSAQTGTGIEPPDDLGGSSLTPQATTASTTTPDWAKPGSLSTYDINVPGVGTLNNFYFGIIAYMPGADGTKMQTLIRTCATPGGGAVSFTMREMHGNWSEGTKFQLVPFLSSKAITGDSVPADCLFLCIPDRPQTTLTVAATSVVPGAAVTLGGSSKVIESIDGTKSSTVTYSLKITSDRDNVLRNCYLYIYTYGGTTPIATKALGDITVSGTESFSSEGFILATGAAGEIAFCINQTKEVQRATLTIVKNPTLTPGGGDSGLQP